MAANDMLRHTLFALILTTAGSACAATVTQTDLTSDGFTAAAFTDPNLKNPWGISYAPGGAFWVSDNNSGLSTLYTGTGSIVPLVVTIPAVSGAAGAGSPTGQVFNATTDFVVSSGGKSGAAVFLFATEDGTISGWNPSVSANSAVIAVNRSGQGAVFKGLAAITNSGANYLLATDFWAGTVDVYDGKFDLVTTFRDNTIPDKFSPYNVAVLGGNIYVTYARVDAQRQNSVSGPGEGVVEEVSFSGTVLQRYTFGQLNAPWGLTLAPSSFGKLAGDLLVGNFGSGTISAFTPALKPLGLLKGSKGKALVIDGLWDLIPGNGGMGGATNTLYFSAGPNNQADGLIGSLSYTK